MMHEHVAHRPSTPLFEAVPKLSGKEDFVAWRQRLTLALSLNRCSQFIAADATVPYQGKPLSAEQLKANSDWDDRDQQVAAGILPTCEESILAATIHLLEVGDCKALAVYQALGEKQGTSGAQYLKSATDEIPSPLFISKAINGVPYGCDE